MPDPLDTLLGLVADGRLTADEAAPLIDALQGSAATALVTPRSATPSNTLVLAGST